MKEYYEYTSPAEITKLVADKVVQDISSVDRYPNEHLTFTFTDGSTLEFEYDYMYEWRYRP